MTDLKDSSGTAADPLTDFDAEWYRRTYPDVDQSPLSAEEHFRKLGRIIGRPPNARAAAGGAPEEADRPGVLSFLPEVQARRFGRGAAQQTARRSTDSLIDPPPPGPVSAAERAATTIEPAPTTPSPRLLAGSVEIARLPEVGMSDAILAPIAAWCRLLGFGTPTELIQPVCEGKPVPDIAERLSVLADAPGHCGRALAEDGPAILREVWFASEGILRFSLEAGSSHDCSDGLVLRAFQFDPDDPAGVCQISEAELPVEGPAFGDAKPHNPLMPVLLVVSHARTGQALAATLLPFPSLLRGGLHAAERAADHIGSTPMDDMWRLSDALLGELLPDRSAGVTAPPLAITTLSVDLSGATGAERLTSPSVRNWLAAIFGLRPKPEAPGSDPAAEDAWRASKDDVSLNKVFSERQDRPGLTLRLSADSLPTLASLVSRRLALPAGQTQASGPFLVAEAVSGRPLWSVGIPMAPVSGSAGSGLPRLTAETPGAGQETSDHIPGHWLAPRHLAIRLVGSEPVNNVLKLMPAAPDFPSEAVGTSATELTIVLAANDPDRARRCLASVVRQDAVVVKALMICADPSLSPETAGELEAVGEAFCPGRSRLSVHPAGSAWDLGQVATETSRANLCLIRDDVVLYDARTLRVMQSLLNDDASVGTVGCALLHETGTGKAAQLRVASAGLFPSHVSLAPAPRLAISEPDCLEALPESAYPVLANQLHLCLIRREALVSTGSALTASAGFASGDLVLGLELVRAGWRNLCTTQVRAGTTQPPVPRNSVDPFGLACALPDRWDDLLASVTVLRQLRG